MFVSGDEDEGKSRTEEMKRENGGRSESNLGPVCVGDQNHQEQNVPDGVRLLQTAPDCFSYLIVLLLKSQTSGR